MVENMPFYLAEQTLSALCWVGSGVIKQDNDFLFQETGHLLFMVFCKQINVLKYDAEVTVEPFPQFSSRRTPLWFQKMVVKTLLTDGFSLNFRSAVSSAIFHATGALLHSRVQ